MTHSAPTRTARRIPEASTWAALYARAQALAPDALGADGHVRNLTHGRWQATGEPRRTVSPVDGAALASLPMLSAADARAAVEAAAQEHATWSTVPLDERRARVADAVNRIEAQRDLLAQLLIWEIGKPYRQALTSVDRTVSGVRWYLEHIDEMLTGRAPLGLISNIASWNYPLSVLVHAMLVQALAGNAVIAKTPTDGGLVALTLAVALAREAGLPFSLVSGSGAQLSEALVRHPDVAALAYVGGKSNGRDIAAALVDRSKRYMLEMEGVNAYGVWDFSDWALLEQHLKKGYEYGKQRCTAYARFVVQRALFPQFLETYLRVAPTLTVGHPLLATEDGQLPDVDFGPLINAQKVEELQARIEEATTRGAVPIYAGTLDPANFLPGQDVRAYIAPTALLAPPRGTALYHAEPFGPVDTFVLVDSVDDLITEMNVSNGNLVATIATDDARVADEVFARSRAYKVGHNVLRSRGDREETFGGLGESWTGAFVGGALLVQAVTVGQPGERLAGNFPEYSLLPGRARRP